MGFRKVRKEDILKNLPTRILDTSLEIEIIEQKKRIRELETKVKHLEEVCQVHQEGKKGEKTKIHK